MIEIDVTQTNGEPKMSACTSISIRIINVYKEVKIWLYKVEMSIFTMATMR